MTQTIAITGATGFIGQRICLRLLDAGYRIRALVRTPGKARELLPGRVDMVEGSLADDGRLAELVRGAGAVCRSTGWGPRLAAVVAVTSWTRRRASGAA